MIPPSPHDATTLPPPAAGRYGHGPAERNGRFAPPPVGPVAAMLRRPLLVAAVVVLCAGAGLALGLARAPVYTAESRLGVGDIDIDSQALPGYVAATQSLAGSYSRAIDSDAVLGLMSSSTGLPRATVGGGVSASPVAESSVIRVDASGATAPEAMRLANAGSDALVRYVRSLGTTDGESTKVLANLRAASLRVERLRRTRQQLTRRYEKAPSGRLARRLQTTAADAETAQAQVQALRSQYQNAAQTTPKTKFINVLTHAQSATSDRRSSIELRVFTGGVAGLLLAAAVATALANGRRRDVPA